MLEFIKEEILNMEFSESESGSESEPVLGPVPESEPERISNQN